MERLSNNKQTGIAILSSLAFMMLAQGILLADKILGHSLLSWWWVWSPSLILLACAVFLVLYMCVRILIVEITLYFTHHDNRGNKTTD